MPESQGVVTGTHNSHTVRFYGLSTCVWCKKTRQLLEDEGVSFEFAYVDLLTGEEKESVREIVRKWNPRESFPTIVIDDEQCVVGFRPDDIKGALGL